MTAAIENESIPLDQSELSIKLCHVRQNGVGCGHHTCPGQLCNNDKLFTMQNKQKL